LAVAIQKLRVNHNLREQLRRAGLENSSHYSYEVINQEFEKIYSTDKTNSVNI
jgi:glycosyltransferase involved in cell wall biosynthesis